MDINANGSVVPSVFETREIDILVFNVGEHPLGISLGKVREITRVPVVKSVPYSHHAIRGLFELRNQLIPALDLRAWLEIKGESPGTGRAIIARFMGLTTGFLVDSVDRIYRINWRDIEPPNFIKRFSDDILGTVKLEERLINMLDYERIVLDINPDVILPHSPERKDSKKLVERRGGKSIWIIQELSGISSSIYSPRRGIPISFFSKMGIMPWKPFLS